METVTTYLQTCNYPENKKPGKEELTAHEHNTRPLIEMKPTWPTTCANSLLSADIRLTE